ncbi:MAG: hypothetical protein ABIN69_17990 [Aestuariivirga sp.]
MKNPLLTSIFLFTALALPVGAEAAGEGTMDHMKMDHSKMMAQSTAQQPTEGGQSAFAAIAEIVALLEADPKTDWSKVDIEALRQHLIDMNNVTLLANVNEIDQGNVVTFEVTGTGLVIDSIRRMVMAHASTMNGVDGWDYAAKEIEGGSSLTVTPPDSASKIKLKGLGFIGMMASGMHHQQHHWMIAKGQHPHN